MKSVQLVLFTVVVLASQILACSSDEAAPHPVPVDAATDASSDGAAKDDVSSEASPDAGLSDVGPDVGSD
jgi:hypothetical protein